MNNIEKRSKQQIRDKALVSYAALRRDREEGILDFLNQTADQLQKSNSSVTDWAYWLWIAGEFTNLHGDKSFIDDHSSMINQCIDKIESSWNQSQEHWIWDDKKGVFLSNLAIYHGALKSINNKFRSEKAQKICKDIREMTFSAFMKGSHFVSRQGSEEVWDDIVAAAVPFGLVSSGDLALLSAIKKLNNQKQEPNLSGLMSWYYCECGQHSLAKQLLDKTSNIFDVKDSELFAIAKDQLLTNEYVSEQVVVFDHNPVGGECPYIFMNNERSPRIVTAGDIVRIKTFLEPNDSLHTIFLEYKVEQQELIRTIMSLETDSEGEQYWIAELAPFSDFANVSYRFRVENVKSNWYSFEVLQWNNIDRVVHVEQAKEQATIYFKSPVPKGNKICLSLSSNDTVTIGCGFSVMEKTIHLESSQENVNERCYIGNIEVQIENSSLQLHLLDNSGKKLSSSFNSEGHSFFQALLDQHGKMYKIRLNYKLNDKERLFGMGERFARLEFKGSELDNYVFNQYKDQGFKTYIPVPFVISTGGYGLFLQSSLYSVFRFATLRDDLMQIEANVHDEKQSLTWYMFTGKPLEIIGQFTSITGKPKLPPKWSFGPWMSSNNWDSEKEVDWQLEQTVKHKIPSTVLVLEQWSDESTFYIWNDAQYEEKSGEKRFTYDDFTFPDWGRWPNPKGMVKRVHDHGLRVLMWQAPVMKYMDGIAHAQRDEDERVMIANHYGVRNNDETPYRIPKYEWFRNSLVPDFTNPEAAKWWLSKRQYLFDEMGVDGFKTDGGECIYGSDLKFYDGRTGAEMRNEYPNNYIEAFYKFANEHVSGGAVTFSRAGYTGAQNTPMHWAGDEKSTFEAFRSSIIAGLSCGMSGIPFWGWDLGGFSGEIPTAELYIRSVQMAAFCPVMQHHAESKGEFIMDRTPWNIAERTGKPEVLTLYKKYADVRMNILPYIYEQAKISSETGYPLMRAMLLAFPDDSYCQELTMQYMFGESLLVAPITEEGASEVEVYLPEGNWLPIFGKHALSGGKTVKVAAALEEIPVYVKADSVIPLNLGEGYQLGDDVGNVTDRYEQLCFMICLNKKVDYNFNDEFGNFVDLSAVRDMGRIEAVIEVIGTDSVTLIFRALGGVKRVINKETDEPYIISENDAMTDSRYCIQRENDLLMKVQPGRCRVTIYL